MMATVRRRQIRAALLAASVGFACGSSGKPGLLPPPAATDGAAPDGAAAPGPFVAVPPHVYGAKVKTLLTGLPLTADELGQLRAAPGAMRGLVDVWMQRPEWYQRMLGFFAQAFQQSQTDINDYDEQLGRTTNPWNPADKVRFVRSAEESFARTARELVRQGRPFTDVLTTSQFMLNPPLASSYAFIDAFPQSDLGKPVPAGLWLRSKFPNLVFVRTLNPDPVTGLPVPIPLEDSINPASPSFMKWYEPNPYQGMTDRCREPDMRVGPAALVAVADFLYGGRPGCGSTRSQFTAADWDDWRMMTIRPPRAGEERTVYWDLPRLRAASTTDLVLATPRVGFFTTPAFFANWPTNVSNSYRAPTNQALIVALGRSFDDRGTTIQVSETSVDNMHVQPGTACFGCHSTLDPMRDFFRQSFSVPYSTQLLDLGRSNIPATGTFTVDGSAAVSGTGVAAFGRALAQHPRFAAAWAQKLCQFANSAACADDDPELGRVVEAFRASNHDFRVLVRELLSSPLVTFAAPTRTAEVSGVAVGIARRETLCTALENRLQLPDLCELSQGTAGVRNLFTSTARNLALSIPGAGYARGDAVPLLPHDPNLFFSSATENLCGLLATQLVDGRAGSRYSSARKDEAIADLVVTLMGLPAGDPRASEMTAILADHHAAALASGVSATLALRSTFTLACQSPLTVSLGL
jgi:Protein of unknown function (DUF1585)